MKQPILKKFVRLWLSCALFGAAALAQNASDTEKLDERFVKESLSLDPVSATAQGLHEYKGVDLDARLTDYSPAAIQKAIQFYRNFLGEVTKQASSHPDLEAQTDLQLIRLQCESQLLDLQDIQSYRHNPTQVVEMIGNGLYIPFVLQYMPEAKRMEQIVARLEQTPTALQSARQDLVSAPQIWIDVAVDEAAGDIDLIDHQIRSKVPSRLRGRYDSAAKSAIEALRSFNSFLKQDLAKKPADWRLGAKFYEEKFKLTLATGDTPAGALHDAEAKLQSIREDMRRQAAAVFPKYFPGETPPPDLNALVSRVLDKVARQHATPANYFPEAKADLTQATAFVRAKSLLALPHADNLQVIPTPEFMRGIYGVGGFAAAPALEPQLGAFYWITPFTADMTPDRIESKLREYNRWGLMILTIHEAMPGHYVQFEYASQVRPKWRGALREIFSNGPYVEGWAVYATQMMIEQGFDNSPEMRLTFGKQMLRVVSNTILDIRLQTMGMTDQQALDLMVHDTFQEKEEARRKLQRAKLSSCQLPTYFVGWRGWDELRARVEKRLGPQFQLAKFHQRALMEGGVPLPALQQLLSGM